MEELNLVVLGKDIKIAAFIVAMNKGYYGEENLTINTQTVSGGFPEAMPALSNGTADVLPFGSIPTCTYVGQGDDLVIFVNSGYGYIAEQGGACAVAFHPNDLIGMEFPCCRQSTNRAAFEEKRSQLIKFEIANLRAMYDIENDREGTIAALMEYSGQPEDYVTAITYGTDSYDPAMVFEMDPYTNEVKTFYGNMVDNGDIENPDKDLIDAHMDSTIYKAALDELIERGQNAEFYEGLLATYEEHNTLGV